MPGTTTPWSYALARPADGTYTLYVRATDTLGNTTSSANLTTATFTIDTVAPAAPVIVGGGPTYPDNDNNTTDLTSPEFTVTDANYPNVTFSCQMDSGTPVTCNGDTDNDDDPQAQGEWQYTNLSAGPHCFSVWATDKAGNVGATTKYCWTVIGPPATIVEYSGSP